MYALRLIGFAIIAFAFLLVFNPYMWVFIIPIMLKGLILISLSGKKGVRSPWFWLFAAGLIYYIVWLIRLFNR